MFRRLVYLSLLAFPLLACWKENQAAAAPAANQEKAPCDCAECNKGHAELKQGDVVRIETPTDAPALGSSSARVTIQMWSDFECPFCSRGANTMKELRSAYGDKVRFVFRHKPLP